MSGLLGTQRLRVLLAVVAPLILLPSGNQAISAEPPPHVYPTHCAARSESVGSAQLSHFTDTPTGQSTPWTETDIRHSRVVHYAPDKLPDRPQFAADPLNLVVVLENAAHYITILDGDKLEPIHRFPSRSALQGDPSFTPDGRYAFFTTRDGWISKFDLWNLKVVLEARVGINTRNAAVSGDGRIIAIANEFPNTLVMLDTDLNLLKLLPVKDREGKLGSRVSAVYTVGPRQSFVAALRDVKEVWEISYNTTAPEIPMGVIHDFQYREGAFVPGFLNPVRSMLADYLDDFSFTPDCNELIGAGRDGINGQVVHLDVRRKIADIALTGRPHLGGGIRWRWQGRPVMATPDLKEGLVTVIDTHSWKTITQIRTAGPGLFLSSHDNTRYAWVDSMLNQPGKNVLTVIDKETLKVAAELRGAPGTTLAHIEFTRDGKYALVSLVEPDGAIIAYDGETLQEVKRIPMNKPTGKYNVWNKIPHLRLVSP